MVDYIGQQLGNYQLTHLLGEGAFAQVYLGEHIYLSTQAAIKILNAPLTNNPVKVFQAEARTIARLVHPNIVRVLEFGVEENIAFLVLDYAPNGTLRQRHPQGTVLPLPTVTSYVKQIAEALQYAHDEKLIHRDVKPENVLLGRRNEVLLSDFGIALMVQTLSNQNLQNIAGTLPYMAPEQIQGQPRPASDQYALGIMAYEWLVGSRPFNGSLTEILSQHLIAAPLQLRGKIPSIAPAVEEVILKALEKDPDKRFGSVREFALALEQGRVPQMRTAVTVQPPSPPPPMPVKPVGTVISSFRGHRNPVNALSWLPDSRRIVSASNERAVRIWDAATGSDLQSYQDQSTAARLVACSADGTRIATVGSDGLIRVWDFTTNRLIGIYRGHQGNTVNAIAWSPAQPHLASAATDGSIHIWDTTTGNQLTIYQGHNGSVNSLAWSHPLATHGYCIVSGGDDTSVQTWEAATGQKVALYRGQSAKILSVAWSPNTYITTSQAGYSSRVACGREDGAVQMWDTQTEREALSYRYPSATSIVAWSPSGRCFACANAARTIEIWDTVTNLKLAIFSHSTPPRVMAWSPDSKYIASGGGDATIQVWAAPDPLQQT